MFFKEETRIAMSSDHDAELEETLNTETTFSMEEEKIRKARVKMEEVKEENERLKLTLSQILKDYNSLKNQYKTQVEEAADQESKKATNLASMAASASDDDEESDLVSLSLGRFSNDSTREKKKINTSTQRESKTLENGGMIELGLSCKPDPDNSLEASRSFDEPKEEEVRSSSSNKNSRSGDDEILQLTKKPRVSVRAVCNTQTMQDGCQWRKYGQKIAKGNPCPRAYYRCTVSSSCPVRKQVQRCIDDMSILITTYEGTHNHPLPPSAAAMASATSAAAAMLSCGSSATSLPSSSSPNNLFGYSGNVNSQNYPRATISSSQSHPTVVLDLTPPNHGTKFASSLFPAAHSSHKSFNFDRSNSLQIGWDHPRFPAMSSGDAALFSGFRAAQAANDRKIAVATTAITHDPNFRSALAAAITSFVGSNNSGSNVGGRTSGMDFLLNFSQPKSRDEGGQIKL